MKDREGRSRQECVFLLFLFFSVGDLFLIKEGIFIFFTITFTVGFTATSTAPSHPPSTKPPFTPVLLLSSNLLLSLLLSTCHFIIYCVNVRCMISVLPLSEIYCFTVALDFIEFHCKLMTRRALIKLSLLTRHPPPSSTPAAFP